jgi:chitodextrinase
MKEIREIKINYLMICSVLFLLCAGGEAFAATYYVSPVGSDGNSGSTTAPFRTIQKAANMVNPGDTVIVRDGTYTDTDGNDMIVSLARGGTSTNWVTFKAENKWGAKLSGQSNATDYGWIFLTGANYVRVEDFEVYGCKKGGFWTNQTASNLYLLGNHIHNIGKWCNPDTGASYGMVGIFQGINSNHTTYDSNLIHDIGRYWIGENGCTTDAGHDNDHGIYVTGAYVDIINNIFYANNSGVDIDVKAQSIVGGGDHFRIINNTFGPTATPKGRIFLAATNQNGYRNDDILIQNNIFRTGQSSGYGIMLWPASTGNIGSGQRNIVVKNNINYTEKLIYPYDAAYASNFTLANNISGEPKFVNLTGRDFHLQSGSPAIDKGLYFAGYDYDADGNPIVGAPDIGAYEYASSTTSSTDTTAPSVPAGLTATGVSSSQINLAWKASTDNVGVSGYKVYRGTTLIATTTTPSFANTGLAAATTYTYRVSAFDATGNVSAQSASASATTQTLSDTQAPTVPANVLATAISTSQINLSWTASSDNVGVTGYKIYRNGTQIANTTATSYSNTGLTASTSYTYAVSAYDTAGNVSGQSASVSTTTLAPADTQAPTVPANVFATAISTSQINLSWTASSDNVGVTGYKIYRNGTQIATATATSYSNTGLTASTSYTYTVSSYDAAGNVSGQSASASAITASATTEPTTSTVIIDNGSSGTSYTGTWSDSGSTGQYGTTSLWSRDGAKYTWTFTPKTSGRYDVSMWWTQWSSRSTKVPVEIVNSRGTKKVYVNQQLNGGKWNSLSSYYFVAGKSYRVSITAQPGPSSTCADAVRFVYKSAK